MIKLILGLCLGGFSSKNFKKLRNPTGIESAYNGKTNNILLYSPILLQISEWLFFLR